MPLGIPELIPILVIVGGPLLAILIAVLWVRSGRGAGRRARQFGYASRREYLGAVPRSDAERRDAVDMVMRGLVYCLLGLIFPPIILFGIVPLFYGGRKLISMSMGLGLVDDGESPRL